MNEVKPILVCACLSLCACLLGCGNRRTSEAELLHKIDSVNRLEVKRQMKLQGIELSEASPFQLFYDSLGLQPLPFSYSEDYVRTLPGYKPVPIAIATYLELEGREAPRAIALPETLGSRLVLLAADQEDGEYELWLYSLDNECFPVDKLLLYEPERKSETHLQLPKQEAYFSVTSDMIIRVWEYASEEDDKGQISLYIVDDSRQFVERPYDIIHEGR